MELLTLNEIIQTIVEETKGLDPELIEDMILKEVDIPSTEIVRLKEELKIDVLDQNFINSILKYSWGNLSILSYQFGYNDDNGINWLIQRNKGYEDYPVLQAAGLIMGTAQYACWSQRETEFIQLMEHITQGVGMPFWHSLVGSY